MMELLIQSKRIVVNMLFKPYHLPMIRKGLKTETRRNWKRKMAKVNGVYSIQTKMFQNRSDSELLKVNYIFKQKLGDMTEDQANKEGGYTLNEFKKKFENINGFWSNELEVYAIGFIYLGWLFG
jgi:hypothetical protein